MGDLLLLAVAGGLFLVVAMGSLPRALVITLPAWLVLPPPLVVPNPLTSALTFHRVLVLALVVAWWRVHRRLPARDRSPAVHLLTGPHGGALIGLGLLTALVVAFGATGPASAGLVDWLLEVLAWGDRMAVLVVAGLVTWDLQRHDPPGGDGAWWWLRGLALGAVALAVLAGAELVTGRAWGQLLLSPLGSLQALDAAGPLEMRGGAVRVRAGAEFALELAWVMTALLPVVLAVAVDDPDRRWRPVGVLGAAAIVPVVLATQARSALLTLPVLMLVWVLVARLEPSSRWIVAAFSMVAAGLLGLAAGAPGLVGLDAEGGSVEVREARLELLTGEVATRPVAGLGVGAVDTLGLPTTDSSYLQLYSELGVLGVGLLLVALVAGLGGMVPVLWSDVRDRPVVVACLLGALTLVAGSFAYDALTLQGSARLLWVLVGVGAAIAASALDVRTFVVPRTRAGVALGMVVAAAVVWLLAPQVASVEERFLTLPATLEVGGGDPVVPFGRTYTATVCEAVARVADEAGLEARCRDEGTAAGMGRYRLAGASADRVAEARDRVGQFVAATGVVPAYRAFTVSPLTTARPVWVATAPVSGVLIGLGLLLAPATGPGGLAPRPPVRAPV